jgi:DNA (cytosine-5)-methyltransferase 1
MKSIELFSGAGGLALGVHLAGFQHQLLVESDNHAFETLRHNVNGESVPGIKSWPLVHATVESANLGSLAQVDLLAAGIPCQPFSNGGSRRGFEDNRNMFPIFAQAIATVSPRAFLLENVNGLVHGRLADHMEYVVLQLSLPECQPRLGQTWRDHLEQLRRIPQDGATYKVSWQVLNAADYGMPQVRKRVFIVGFKRDPGDKWRFPVSTHSRNALLYEQSFSAAYWSRHHLTPQQGPHARGINDGRMSPVKLNPWKTVRDATEGLPEPSSSRESELQHTLITGAKSYRGHTGSYIDWPAKSLKAGVHGVGGGENMLRDEHGHVRYFTVRECARLQTFPDSWTFCGPWSSVTRQLGNAVPVTLAAIVARSIKQALARPRESYPESLLKVLT